MLNIKKPCRKEYVKSVLVHKAMHNSELPLVWSTAKP